MSDLLSLLVVKRDIAVAIFVRCICMRPSVRICPGHKSYIYAGISKLLGTVVVLEEEKCHLKHLGR